MQWRRFAAFDVRERTTRFVIPKIPSRTRQWRTRNYQRVGRSVSAGRPVRRSWGSLSGSASTRLVTRRPPAFFSPRRSIEAGQVFSWSLLAIEIDAILEFWRRGAVFQVGGSPTWRSSSSGDFSPANIRWNKVKSLITKVFY